MLGPDGIRQLVGGLAVVALAGVLAFGCDVEDYEPPQSGESPVQSKRDRPRPAAPVASRFPGPSRRARRARVTGVSDGDTIQLSGIDDVRLIGVDTPEVYGGVECFGRAASGFTRRVLRPGRRVRYQLGLERRDQYGRALAYVWLRDGRLFNGLLVARGYAQPSTVPPNDELATLFVRAGRRARRAARGLWGRPGCAGQHERDCQDFATQRAAQRYFDRRGGSPTKDVDDLDGDDRDGRVCESLP